MILLLHFQCVFKDVYYTQGAALGCGVCGLSARIN